MKDPEIQVLEIAVRVLTEQLDNLISSYEKFMDGNINQQHAKKDVITAKKLLPKQYKNTLIK